MAMNGAGFLQTGAPGVGTDGTIYTDKAAATADPSAPSARTIRTGGWRLLDMWIEVKVNAVAVKMWGADHNAALWGVDRAFGSLGELTLQVGKYRISHECLGAEYSELQVTDVGVAGTITMKATLSQAVPR